MSETHQNDTRTPLAMSLAVALHILVAAVLLVYFWQARAPMMAASEHVFELVTAPSPNPDNAAASAGSPAQAIHAPVLPKITPMPPLPPPSKAPSPPTPPKPAPTPTPTAMTSYEKFLIDHPLPKNSPTPTRTSTSRAVPLATVSDTQIQNDLKNFGTSTGNPNETAHSGQPSSGVTNSYVDGLKARLQAAYENPPQLVDPDLAAGVEITIAADGRVIERRLTKSSGNAAFDAAVQAALERVTMVDPPPNGQQTFIFTFKNVAQ